MVSVSPFQLHFETVQAASLMLGHGLENRSRIRWAQDPGIVRQLEQASESSLRNSRFRDSFVVAPLDVLVTRRRGAVEFHVIEMNGTGIGGISNMPESVVSAIAESLSDVASECWEPEGVLLLPVSGKESEDSPRLNRLMHEKLIFAEAMQAGLRRSDESAQIVTLEGIRRGVQSLQQKSSAVVIGYIKELLEDCEVDEDGLVYLRGRRVLGAVNDRFCLNLFSKWEGRVDTTRFTAINGTYLAGGDKGVAYALLDEFLVNNPQHSFPNRVEYTHAFNRADLVSTVVRWLCLGRRPVIKPHGTGIGHGIEFFLHRHESVDSIVRRIDHSLRITEEYYAAEGGAFPYTVCDYVDAAMIVDPQHPLAGHKYELRVVVYRDGYDLKACPTIAKIAKERFDESSAGRHNLINNITHSAVASQSDGTGFMMPLCSEETLALLGLSLGDMEELCRVATCYVRHAVNNVHRLAKQFPGQPAWHADGPSRLDRSRVSVTRR